MRIDARGGSVYFSALTVWNPDGSRELCELGSALYRARCFEGVVKNLLGVLQTTDGAFDFCAGAPAAAKRSCFEVLGKPAAGLHADRASRYEECDKAGESSRVAICQHNAGSSSQDEDEMFSGRVTDQ